MQIKEVILAALRRECKNDRTFVLAIDGRCGSGKSTMAAALSADLNCPLIHLDDFFLRPQQRTAERYATPGENVDHERFEAEVLRPIREGRAFSYRPYICGTQAFGESICVHPAPVMVVEGSYSCHPSLRDYYDLTVFLSVSPDEQLRRIIMRSDAEEAQRFAERWIPLEEKYFSAFSVEEKCDLSFDTTGATMKKN